MNKRTLIGWSVLTFFILIVIFSDYLPLPRTESFGYFSVVLFLSVMVVVPYLLTTGKENSPPTTKGVLKSGGAVIIGTIVIFLLFVLIFSANPFL